MKPGHIVVCALVAVLGLAAVFEARHWLDHRSYYNPAPVGPMAVDLLAKNMEEGFQAIERRWMNPVLDFSGAQPIDTDAMPFDPNARVGVIRGTKREEYPIPNQDGDAEAEMAGPDAKVEVDADPVAAVADDGMRAMSISISDIHDVTGLVLPGDHVDIMLTRDSYTDILLQNIKVLDLDHLADRLADQPKSGKTATLEVNTVDAQKLILAQTAGTLSIALRAAGSVDAAAPRRITMKDLGPNAVDLLKNVEESFQAIENRINQMGQEFKGTQPGFEARRGFCGCRPHCVNRGLAEYAVLCRGQEFRGTQPIDTEAMPFDPNARVGVIRGMSRQEYDVPELSGDAPLEHHSIMGKCAAAGPRHPFAGRHPCFPE